MAVSAQTSWHWSEFWAFVVVLVALIGLWLWSRAARAKLPVKIGGALNGADNRWSTSLTMISAWTLVILWSFITLLIRYRASAFPEKLQNDYFLLLGIPGGAAIGAKALTVSNIKAGAPKTARVAPTGSVGRGLGQLFTDDTGAIDVLDSQYVAFNLVLLAYYVTAFFGLKITTTNVALPDLPDSLLALSGVSAVTYLGKKGLPGVPGAVTFVTGGSRLKLAATSNIRMPEGGTLTMTQAGKADLAAGTSVTSSVDAPVQADATGSVTLEASCSITVTKGAKITAPVGSSISFDLPGSAVVSNGSSAVDSGGNPITGSGALSLPAGANVRLIVGGSLILDADSSLTVPAGTVVVYLTGGTITVNPGPGPVPALVSAGAILGHSGVATVGFPAGAAIISGSGPGSTSRLDAGASQQLSASVGGNPAITVTLARKARAMLAAGTSVTIPGAVSALTAGTAANLVAASTLDLPAGAVLTFDGDAKLHAPKGSIVEIADGKEAATVSVVATG